jgi:hypothetical protein
MLFWGGLATMGGFTLVRSARIASLAVGGFLLVGLGASNIVPVLFVALARSIRCRPASPSRQSRQPDTRAFSSVRLRSAPSQNRSGFQLRFGCWLRSSARSC